MDYDKLIENISDKNVDVDYYVDLVLKDEDIKREVVKQLLNNNKIMVYYHCYYIISKSSELKPEYFYEYWNDFVLLLKHKNSYHRSIALTIIGNLIKVDKENYFEKIFDDYTSLFNDEKFMTAHCFVENCSKIINNCKQFSEELIDILLDVDKKCDYPDKQRGLLKAAIIQCFEDSYNFIEDKEKIHFFVKNQINSVSPKTRKKAKEFLKKNSDSNE
jgi:hypothetical protein